MLASCISTPAADPLKEQPAQLFGNLGDHRRPISTRIPLAQQYFDEALVWTFAFNYDEAARSFREAARLDPTCAMAHWGIALVQGPHINLPTMTPDRGAEAWKAISRARELRDYASGVERELIDALGERYASEPPEKRRPLDQAYADAMRRVWERHSDDADVCALFAESLMDLQPWDLWTPRGEPKGATEEILKVVEHGLRIAPHHPGLCHYYIHALEQSPFPERAVPAADRLGTLVPGASHLLHMPAHLYTRLGRHRESAEANRRATLSDQAYLAKSPQHDFWNVYRAHNYHFLAYDLMMLARRDEALEAAAHMIERLAADYVRRRALRHDGTFPVELMVMIRFGMWDEILSRPDFPEYLPVSRALRRYARGIAHSATGRVDQAAAELDAFTSARKAVTAEMTVKKNQALDVLAVAEHMLRGELAWRRGAAEEAFAFLRRGIELEDALRYDEPPGWMMPLRHALGAFLVAASRADEAEAVYRKDLEIHPDNGWALLGLAECLRARGSVEGEARIRERLAVAWSTRTYTATSSCACQPWNR